MFAVLEVFQFLAGGGERLYEVRGRGADARLLVGPPGFPGQARWLDRATFLREHRARLLDRLDEIGRVIDGAGPRLTAGTAEDLLGLAVAPGALGAARRSGDWKGALRRGLRGDR